MTNYEEQFLFYIPSPEPKRQEPVVTGSRRLPKVMETTSKTTAKSSSRYSWISYRASTSIDNQHVWVFVDGSSTGWHSAVVVEHGKGERSLASFVEKTSMRNVSSELDAMLLGLANSPIGSKVIMVHDYLGIGAWMIGAWKIKKDGVRKRILEAKRLVEERDLIVSFIHHGGHQKDTSHFTYWNNLADGLCSDGINVDSYKKWEDLKILKKG